MKSKIAISIDNSLLKTLDSKVDKSVIRSRSQAVEFFLKKGLNEQSVDTAVLLLKGEQHELALRQIKGKALIEHQVEFFSRFGINRIFLITQHSKKMNLLLAKKDGLKIEIEIVDAKGNAEALLAIKNKINKNFIVMSGDTYNNFDILKMIKKHSDADKIATMGLMTKEKPSSYG